MNSSGIREISPLYNYWISKQTDQDEKERLLMPNFESNAVKLFAEEPYKWENLFQGIIREIINGDKSSINGLKILLSTISTLERKRTIDLFYEKGFFDESIIQELKGINSNVPTPKNFKPFRFLRILFVIFTNPYGIEMRREKKHIYEKSGAFVSTINKKIFR